MYIYNILYFLSLMINESCSKVLFLLFLLDPLCVLLRFVFMPMRRLNGLCTIMVYLSWRKWEENRLKSELRRWFYTKWSVKLLKLTKILWLDIYREEVCNYICDVLKNCIFKMGHFKSYVSNFIMENEEKISRNLYAKYNLVMFLFTSLTEADCHIS